MQTEAQRLSEAAHRIGEALGEKMGGRFNVLGNVSKEEATGLPVRTLQIVDRWGVGDEDLSCIIEIRKPEGATK